MFRIDVSGESPNQEAFDALVATSHAFGMFLAEHLENVKAVLQGIDNHGMAVSLDLTQVSTVENTPPEAPRDTIAAVVASPDPPQAKDLALQSGVDVEITTVAHDHPEGDS